MIALRVSLLSLALPVLLAACATTRPPVHLQGDAATLGLQEQRERSLADTDHWTLEGKLSVQDGWTVDYKQWDATRQPAMPTRVFAEKAPYKVRLSVENWSFGQ